MNNYIELITAARLITSHTTNIRYGHRWAMVADDIARNEIPCARLIFKSMDGYCKDLIIDAMTDSETVRNQINDVFDYRLLFVK